MATEYNFESALSLVDLEIYRRTLADNAAQTDALVNSPALKAGFVSAVVLSGAGIDPTGVADSTAAIQAKIDSAAATGARVVAPAGTFRVAGLIIRNRTVLVGAGPDVTTFMLPDGGSGDVMVSDGFSGLTGGGTSGGPAGVILSDFTIDGNKAADLAGGWGLRKYGYRWLIRNVSVRNCNGGGIYSEWGLNAGAGLDGGFMEDLVSNVRVFTNVGIGVQWRGPHDSRFEQVLIYANGGHGFTIEGGTAYHSGGIICDSVHVYGNGGDGVRVTSPNMQGASVNGSTFISESNTGTGLVLSANGSVITSGNFYNNGLSGIDIQGGAAGYSIYACLQNNAGSQITFTNDGGNAVIGLAAFTASVSQVGVTGSHHSSTVFFMSGTGTGTNTNKADFPGSVTAANGLTVSAGVAFLNDAVTLRLPRTSTTNTGYFWYDATTGRLSYRDGVANATRDLAILATASNTSLNTATDAINTAGKFQGKQVYNTSANRPVWATGATATSTWVYADGTTAHTPV